MLMVTEDAIAVIRGLIDSSPNPADAGLRIASQPEEDGQARIELSVIDEPAGDDVVVTVSQARIYMDPVVAKAFHSKVLHAEEAHDGHVRFMIADQIEGLDETYRNGDGPEGGGHDEPSG